jgi:DNA invertase Pin-like site-specific DNA recombinase
MLGVGIMASNIDFTGWVNEKVGAYLRTSQQRDRKKGEETVSQSFEIENSFIPQIPKGAVEKTTELGYVASGKSKKLERKLKPLGGLVQVYDDGQASGFERSLLLEVNGDNDLVLKESGRRPALVQLLKDIAEKKITKVVVVSTDRVGNDTLLFAREADFIRELGAEIVDLATGYNTTSLKRDETGDLGDIGNNMMLSIFASTAEISKKTQIQKSMIGTARARGTGVCQGNMGWILSKDYVRLEEVIRDLDEFKESVQDTLAGSRARTALNKVRRDTGKVMSDADIAREFGFGKKDPDTKAIRTWREKFKQYREKGVLDLWLGTLRSIQELQRMGASKAQVLKAITNNSCFLLYPYKGANEKRPKEEYPVQTREDILGYLNMKV